MSDNGLCETCGVNPAEDDHPCPYAQEINDDNSKCRCCGECEKNCCDDI